MNTLSKAKHSKNNRTLDIYVRLCEGHIIKKPEEALRFGVDERSIQRDIDDIRAFLADRRDETSADMRKIKYSRNKQGFFMAGQESSLMSNSEILAVSKILLESRAFSKEEIDALIRKLIAGCVPLDNMKLVSDLIANEKYHYVEVHNSGSVHEKLWELGLNIKQSKVMNIMYERRTPSLSTVKHCIVPVSILFSEYYFYLNAFILKKDSSGRYTKKYDYPTIFRIDRIKKYKNTNDTFQISYANRFEEGEFRKRIQFMYTGELMKLRFSYTGSNVDAIMDRLPTAKIIKQTDDNYIIDAEAYGKGILMWFLSQGPSIEILKPEAARQELKKLLSEMLAKY